MMERAADAWEHQSFKDIVVKVANLEIYYRALNFYLQEQPSLLTDLLAVLTQRIDVTRYGLFREIAIVIKLTNYQCCPHVRKVGQYPTD